jgi:tetratricopeptide (TPR) repeat protein
MSKVLKNKLVIAVLIACTAHNVNAQNNQVNSRIETLLLNGEYEKVADTCKIILSGDTLNPMIFYSLGIAYQNLLNEDLSLNCFSKAVSLNPENKIYNFTLGKSYYSKGKLNQAEPIFCKLYSLDTLNWIYAYYLSSIYMQSSKYDSALYIYKKFLSRDSANYVYLDRTGYVYLKKGDFAEAIDLYGKSLQLNYRNPAAIRNLAYLYAVTGKIETAIETLTMGIGIDSTDMDLYISRAQLNYSKNYTKKALDDYLVILASGDSSKLYLKRAGIGYSYNLEPDKAIPYLLLAFKADSSDYETSSYLGQCYFKIQDNKNSIRYYTKAIDILTPVKLQLGKTFELIAQSQKANKDMKDAIANYQNAYSNDPDPNIYMEIANIYDDKLHNKEKAIIYYQKFLNAQKNSKIKFPPGYFRKIEKRINYLKNPPVTTK